MNIVLVTGALGDGAGGLSTSVRAWAEALADSGHEVTVFYLGLEGIFGESRLPKNPAVRLFRVPCFRERLTRFVFAPTFYRMLDAFCGEHAADIIHANGVWLPGTRVASRVAEKYGVPFVISPHGHLQPWALEYRAWKKRLAWSAYARRSLEAATVAQVASENERIVVEALLPGVTVSLVPNIVELPVSNGSAFYEPGKKHALFLSRLHPSKGIEALIEAWSALDTEGWRLLIVGPDELGYKKRLRRCIEQLGMEEDIRLEGAVDFDCRADYFKAADLFVLPSYSENFAIVIGEAMAASLPVIATRAAPWPELVEQGCGWWIDVGVDALRESLRDALSRSPEELEHMGENAKKCIESKCSRDSVLQCLIEAYERAMVTFKGQTCN